MLRSASRDSAAPSSPRSPTSTSSTAAATPPYPLPPTTPRLDGLPPPWRDLHQIPAPGRARRPRILRLLTKNSTLCQIEPRGNPIGLTSPSTRPRGGGRSGPVHQRWFHAAGGAGRRRHRSREDELGEYKKRIERAKKGPVFCLSRCRQREREAVERMREDLGRLRTRMLQGIQERAEKWYRDEGYACFGVVNFGNLNSRGIVLEVDEGDITQLAILFQEKLGNVWRGILSLISFQGSCPNSLAKATYSMKKHRGRQAMRNIQSIELFSDISMNPQTDEENEGGIVVEINLKEQEPKSAELSTEWSVVPVNQGWPTLIFFNYSMFFLLPRIDSTLWNSYISGPEYRRAQRIYHRLWHPPISSTLRYSLKLTKFIPLKEIGGGAGKPPPPVLILNGQTCDCVGDLPSYDAFPLGGPYSVRGYSMGKLVSCRNNLEVGAELRIPVKNTQVYAFVEHVNDLGSSKELKGCKGEPNTVAGDKDTVHPMVSVSSLGR